MVWVYILYLHNRMILDEIEAPSLIEADKILEASIVDRVMKRSDIGAYPRDICSKQWKQDLLNNLCFH